MTHTKIAEDHKNVRKVNKHSHNCVNVDIRSDFFLYNGHDTRKLSTNSSRIYHTEKQLGPDITGWGSCLAGHQKAFQGPTSNHRAEDGGLEIEISIVPNDRWRHVALGFLNRFVILDAGRY